jgi:hypothetical protein
VKSLVFKDLETEETIDLGVIVRKRRVDAYDAWLSYSEAARTWWITLRAADGRYSRFGWVEARREACWRTFLDLDEAEIVRLHAEAPN